MLIDFNFVVARLIWGEDRLQGSVTANRGGDPTRASNWGGWTGGLPPPAHDRSVSCCTSHSEWWCTAHSAWLTICIGYKGSKKKNTESVDDIFGFCFVFAEICRNKALKLICVCVPVCMFWCMNKEFQTVWLCFFEVCFWKYCSDFIYHQTQIQGRTKENIWLFCLPRLGRMIFAGSVLWILSKSSKTGLSWMI